MSYVFEGEITSSFSNSIITDTNISTPATISGTIIYDTDVNNNAGSSLLGSRYNLISVDLTITSQTDVELTISSDKAGMNLSLFNTGIYIPSIDITNSSSLDINWSGGGLGLNTSSYIPNRLKIILAPQTGVLLPTEEVVLSPNPISGGIEFALNQNTVKGKMTSIEVVEGNKSKAKSSNSDSSSSGALSLFTSMFLLLFLTAAVFFRRSRAQACKPLEL